MLPFAAKIRYKSIILPPMAEGGAQAPGAPSLYTPLASGISMISARGVLMVRPDTKSEGGGGGVLYASAHLLLPFDVLRLQYNIKV